jgi:hypothetical protein
MSLGAVEHIARRGAADPKSDHHISILKRKIESTVAPTSEIQKSCLLDAHNSLATNSIPIMHTKIT